MSLSSMSFTLPDNPTPSSHRKSELGKSGIDQRMLDDLYNQLMTTEQPTESRAVPPQS